MMAKLVAPLLPPAMENMLEGNWATMEVKMSSDMPLPMPRSVMSSPSHMMRPVPAVMVMMMSSGVTIESPGTMSWARAHPWKSWPLLAVATMVLDWSSPRPMVR